MNNIILDCCVQHDTKLFSDIASFNVSAVTGTFTTMDNKDKNRFTYIKIIYPNEIDEYIESIIQPGAMIRIYGKLDSELYTTKTGKNVYNKIICADKVVRIKYDKETQEYFEVI